MSRMSVPVSRSTGPLQNEPDHKAKIGPGNLCEPSDGLCLSHSFAGLSEHPCRERCELSSYALAVGKQMARSVHVNIASGHSVDCERPWNEDGIVGLKDYLFRSQLDDARRLRACHETPFGSVKVYGHPEHVRSQIRRGASLDLAFANQVKLLGCRRRSQHHHDGYRPNRLRHPLEFPLVSNAKARALRPRT